MPSPRPNEQFDLTLTTDDGIRGTSSETFNGVVINPVSQPGTVPPLGARPGSDSQPCR